MSEATADPVGGPVDAAAFWHAGPLPSPADAPDAAATAGPGTPGTPGTTPGAAADRPGWLGLVGRPEITVDGRNLADVLTPLYRALTDPD